MLTRSSQFKQDTFTTDTGDVIVRWPAVLTGEDYADLEGWLDMLKRKIRRSVSPNLKNDGQANIEMDQRNTGLYNKFTVTRNDGASSPGGKHHSCEYFVLDITHDPFAATALRAYAEACQKEYPVLAADLWAKVGRGGLR